MDSDTEQNQTETEFVCEKQFNETIKVYLDERYDKEKPLWTRKRIEETITIIEQFKLAPILKLKRTNKQYYYGKKYDVMEIGNKKSLILKRMSDSDQVVKILPAEEFYHVLRETHQSTGHGGRDKMLYNLKYKYFIPTSVVLEFLKLCTICQSKKKFPRKGIVVCPIVSSDFNHRGQVDLVDLQSTPDRNYKWLLHYQDHATKFSFLRPLTSKRATEVAIELLKIFLEVGCPYILQSDNGREFTAAVIHELTSMWPTCKIVNGRPRHPASQGSVERSNQDVEAMLRAWLIDNNTKNWAIGCYFVQFQKNSSFHRTIKRSPYKALFGMKPKTGLHSTYIPTELLEKLVTEEDLTQFVNQQHDNTSTSEDIPADALINYNASTSEDLPADVLINNNASTSEDPALTRTKSILLVASKGEAVDREEKAFCVVCEVEFSKTHLCDICRNPVHATCGNTVNEEGYESRILCYLCQNERNIKEQREHTAQNLKISAEKMKDISLKKFKEVLVGSTVLIDVPKVDRGPLDASNITGIVLNIKNKLFQIGTPVGIIKDWIPRNSLQLTTTTISMDSVPQIKLSLREIARKLSFFGGQGFKKCSCEKSKIQCKTNRCACKRNNVQCNSRCHKTTTCFNKK